MKALQIDRTGSLDDLAIRDVPEEPLRTGDVRVQVEAAGINPSDIGIALGKFPHLTLPRILGRDFAGRVIQGDGGLVGADVWGSGGSELGLTRDGAHAEFVDVPASGVARRPTGMSAEQAAASSLPFFTAWSALYSLAGLKAGEWAIVAGAAGSVGTAAVQLALALGGHAIGLVTEQDDVTPLDGLTVTIVRSGRDDLGKVARDLTNGNGAEVALNGVGAPVFAALFDALALNGRMVVFSAAAGREAQLDLFALYRKRLKLFGLDTAAAAIEEVARTLGTLGPLFESGAIRPLPIGARYALSQAPQAYRAVNDNTVGKAVLVPG